MKKTLLSKNKILLEHNVPIYVKGSDKPVSNIDMKVRYKWGKDYGTIPSSEGFVIVLSSVDRSLENLAFKWKICNAIRSGCRYIISGVKPHYIRKKIDGIDLLVVNHIMIDDVDFIQRLRDKRLNDILSQF